MSKERLEIPIILFFPGARTAPRPLCSGGRVRGREHHCLVFSYLYIFVAKSTGLGRYPTFLDVKFHIECIHNHLWGALGARDMTTFVKHVLFADAALGDNHT